MLPGSNLRHNPTITGMDFYLRSNRIRQHTSSILDYSGAGLITGSLNCQNFHSSEKDYSTGDMT
jgi:hypothetical protein